MLIALATYGTIDLARRTWREIPMMNAEKRGEELKAKKDCLASQAWTDPRPMNLLVGDSHIEFGNWYPAFHGEFAVRNCGMATARIQDVADLLGKLKTRNIQNLVIHCGINNIGNNETAEECLRHYESLLDSATKLNAKNIVVIPVMPVQERFFNTKSGDANLTVKKFNSLLMALCHERGYHFHSISHRIADEKNGLKKEFTNDGLHLNNRGYNAIYPEICEILRKN